MIISTVDGYIEEKNGNKYLNLVSTDKNKEELIKYTELWDKIEYLIKKIYNKPSDYGEKYMKIKYNSDDNVTFNKILKIDNMTIVIKSVFQEDGKYYPQIFLDECLCKLQMLEHDRIDISEGINVNKTNASKEFDICHYWYFKDIGFKYEPYLCNGCHGLMQKAINFNDVDIVSFLLKNVIIEFIFGI